MEEKPCCEDWEPNNKILDDYMKTAVRYGMGDYAAEGGKPFRFCPWCGAGRPEVKGEDA